MLAVLWAELGFFIRDLLAFFFGLDWNKLCGVGRGFRRIAGFMWTGGWLGNKASGNSGF